MDDTWAIRHSDETNIVGYFILEPKRHFLDLSEADEAEISSFGSMVSLIVKALREVVDCERVYTFSFAEAVPHFHLHLVPRHADFPRAYRGRAVTTYPLQPRASKELVDEVCERMRRALRRQGLETKALVGVK